MRVGHGGRLQDGSGAGQTDTRNWNGRSLSSPNINKTGIGYVASGF